MLGEQQALKLKLFTLSPLEIRRGQQYRIQRVVIMTIEAEVIVITINLKAKMASNMQYLAVSYKHKHKNDQ